MSKSLFAVFGATGNQGNSAANFVLDDAELSTRYSVRAISRDISNPKMQALASKGAELVQADLDDPSTLPAALKNATHLFFLTTTQYSGNSREIETRQAKALCEEALKQGIQYIIFSSMSHPFKISNGALKHVEHFDDKAEIELYIRSLPVQSAFFAPASFMQNVTTSFMKPHPSPAGDGSFVLSHILPGTTPYPLIDISDTGAWIGAVLADPAKYNGKFFAAADALYSLEQMCDIMGKVTGKKVTYQRIPDDVFKSFLPPTFRDALYEMWILMRDYGYYGADTKEQVQWTREQARSRITGFEEFLRKVGYTLD